MWFNISSCSSSYYLSPPILIHIFQIFFIITFYIGKSCHFLSLINIFYLEFIYFYVKHMYNILWNLLMYFWKESYTYLPDDCNLQCWEWSQKCQIKNYFNLPDNIFYSIIINGLKAWAGMLITGGCSKEKADFELKKIAVTIKISRELTLKNNSKNWHLIVPVFILFLVIFISFVSKNLQF